MYNGFHNVWQILWLDARHVLADVEADNGLVAGDPVHHARHFRVNAVLAQVQPGNKQIFLLNVVFKMHNGEKFAGKVGRAYTKIFSFFLP